MKYLLFGAEEDQISGRNVAFINFKDKIKQYKTTKFTNKIYTKMFLKRTTKAIKNPLNFTNLDAELILMSHSCIILMPGFSMEIAELVE